MPCDKVLQAYAYILTHPGIPTVYAPHVYEWGLRAGIKALIAARAAAGVTSTSRVTIVRAESGLYVATVDGAVTQLTVKLGPGAWAPPAGWAVVASGADYAVYAPFAAPPPSPNPGGTGVATFTCEQGFTAWGENVYVVGSVPALGSWNPANAVKLSPTAYPTWSGSISGLPAAFEFKFIKKNGAAVTWESGSNRVSSSGTAGAWR
jgi:alpha-amylase